MAPRQQAGHMTASDLVLPLMLRKSLHAGGGVVRPEEIAQGHIDHALSLMVPVIRSGYIASPATATDGSTNAPNAIPEGAHLQLDPSVNVDAQPWPTWEKVIAKALQTYGAYVSDHGGSLAFYGQTDMNAGNTTWRPWASPKMRR